MISTKGRYALRALIDLAIHGGREAYVPMRDLAQRQEISLKYLERILPLLKENGLVEAAAGRGGGYRLRRLDVSVLEVLEIVEGDLAPVACLRNEGNGCKRSAICATLPMWQKFNAITRDFFAGITLADLARDSRNTDLAADS